MLREVAAGVPSYLTHDLTAPQLELTREEIRERMSGNLCRCGAHNGIVDAILSVAVENAA
jgi:xanthine dehydrogenase YagT iron-sulfur-binding subunit